MICKHTDIMVHVDRCYEYRWGSFYFESYAYCPHCGKTSPTIKTHGSETAFIWANGMAKVFWEVYK